MLLTTIGTAGWSTLLILAGWSLGSGFEDIETYVSLAGDIVIGIAIIIYLYRVLTFRRHVKRRERQ